MTTETRWPGQKKHKPTCSALLPAVRGPEESYTYDCDCGESNRREIPADRELSKPVITQVVKVGEHGVVDQMLCDLVAGHDGECNGFPRHICLSNQAMDETMRAAGFSGRSIAERIVTTNTARAGEGECRHGTRMTLKCRKCVQEDIENQMGNSGMDVVGPQPDFSDTDTGRSQGSPRVVVDTVKADPVVAAAIRRVQESAIFPTGNLDSQPNYDMSSLDPSKLAEKRLSDLDELRRRANNSNTKDSKQSNPKDAVGVRKARWFSYLPLRVMLGIGLALLEGARKYGRHNYRVAGVRASVYVDAVVCGHLMPWMEGEDIDPDTMELDTEGKPIPGTGLNHIDKALASLIVLRDGMYEGNWVDDRPPAVKEWPAFIAEYHRRAAAIIDRYKDPKAPFTHEDTVWRK